MLDISDYRRLAEGNKTVTQIAFAGAMLLVVQGLTSPALSRAVTVANAEGYVSDEAAIVISAGLLVAGIATVGLGVVAGATAAMVLGTTGL